MTTSPNKMTNQSKHHMQGGLQMANGRNQSELKVNLILDLNIILHNHFQVQRRATVEGFANAQIELATYIIANYTPKSDIPNFMRPGNLIPYTIINGVKYVELDWLIAELTKE